MSRDMVPVARLLAFYLRTDGEVVADSLSFFVNGSTASDVPPFTLLLFISSCPHSLFPFPCSCSELYSLFLLQVTVTVNRAKDLRMETIEVNGFAEEGSYMAFSAVNYDFWMMGGDPMFSEYDVSILF